MTAENTNLITITETEIGDELVPTVNARETHRQLEIIKNFATWVKSQIKRAKLVQDRDYVVFSQKGENPQGGRPSEEYALTLDAAKHIALMSNTQQGSVYRNYLIKFEKEAKKALQIDNTPHARAITSIKYDLQVAEMFGLPKHLAQSAAVKHARITTGVDFGHVLLMSPVHDNIDPADRMLEPTDLGKVFHLSGVKMNRKLAELGLQTKTSEGWVPTTEGDTMSMGHHWDAQKKDGYNYKWNLHKVREKMLASGWTEVVEPKGVN